MDTKNIERISKALGDKTRLRIFAAIAAKDNLTCGDLVKMRGVTAATMSHHLKILLDADLIACEKKGQFVHSRAVRETIEEYGKALAKIAERDRAKKSKRRGS
jgi:ArsR family transcriptional regulator